MPTICKVNCQLHMEFKWAHQRIIHFEKTLDWLDDIRFNQLELLESRAPWLEKIEVIKTEIRKIKRRIRQIEHVLKNGCFLCYEGGIVFV